MMLVIYQVIFFIYYRAEVNVLFCVLSKKIFRKKS